MSDDESDVNEEKFAADLIGQIEDKVMRKFRQAGIEGVTVRVNREDYSLDFHGSGEAVARARKLLEDEKAAQRKMLEEMEDLD